MAARNLRLPEGRYLILTLGATILFPSSVLSWSSSGIRQSVGRTGSVRQRLGRVFQRGGESRACARLLRAGSPDEPRTASDRRRRGYSGRSRYRVSRDVPVATTADRRRGDVRRGERLLRGDLHGSGTERGRSPGGLTTRQPGHPAMAFLPDVAVGSAPWSGTRLPLRRLVRAVSPSGHSVRAGPGRVRNRQHPRWSPA